jgi:hypothetical protein
MLTTPIVILGFNRPAMTQQVFDAVAHARPDKLFLVMDGPRDGNVADQESVAATRGVVAKVEWPCEVVEIFAAENLGLKKRIVSGLTAVFAVTNRAIILEDDCVPDGSFFRYCDELLNKYAEDSRVGVISGSSRLRGQLLSPHSYDFSADLRIWGWATWARTWDTFVASGDLEASWDEAQQAEIAESFPHGARRSAMKKMLNTATTLDSWALPFAVHCGRQGYVSAVPAENLVENIGFGHASTHTKFEDYVAQVPASSLPFPLIHPEIVAPHPHLDALESRLDAREWWAYPLRHPLDTLARFVRYGIQRARTRFVRR